LLPGGKESSQCCDFAVIFCMMIRSQYILVEDERTEPACSASPDIPCGNSRFPAVLGLRLNIQVPLLLGVCFEHRNIQVQSQERKRRPDSNGRLRLASRVPVSGTAERAEIDLYSLTQGRNRTLDLGLVANQLNHLIQYRPFPKRARYAW
jgi:hypothetical protein